MDRSVATSRARPASSASTSLGTAEAGVEHTADAVVLAVPGLMVEEITRSLGDLSGKITDLNSAAARIFGRSRDDLMGAELAGLGGLLGRAPAAGDTEES